MAKRMTARLWTFAHGSPVRLTIRAGSVVEWGESHATEEGYASESERFEFDGSTVTRESSTDGRDCDGRLSTHAVSECPVHLLRSHRFDGDAGEGWPDWRNVRRGQRDFSAEAMGY